MKPVLQSMVVLVLLVAAFYGGTVFGIRQGVTLGRWADGLLRAETARRNLVLIEKGNVAEVKAWQETELQENLQQHYNLMHYDYPFLMMKQVLTA